MTKYTSDDPDILSFEHGQTIRIYSKSAGSRMDLWGGEVNGKRGYVPFKMLHEFQVYEHAPNFVLPTQVSGNFITVLNILTRGTLTVLGQSGNHTNLNCIEACYF